MIALTGCAPTKVWVIDSQADVVRLGGNCRGDVFIFKAGEWVQVKNVKLPAGWYAGAVKE